MRKSKFLLPAFLSVAALGLAACSSGDAQSSADSTTSESTALEKLQESGVLTVGTEGTYAPFTYHDPETGDLTGYDVEVIEAVANYLGVTAEFSEVKWDGIFAGLESGRYDVVANQVSVNPEREALYDFSSPYATATPVVVVATGNDSITAIGDVEGATAAQSITSNWADLAREAGAEVTPVDGFTESVAALRDGRVDLTFNDNLAVLEYIQTTGDDSVKVAFELPEDESVQAFATRKGSDLAPLLTEALEALAADGTLAEIGAKYFGADIS